MRRLSKAKLQFHSYPQVLAVAILMLARLMLTASLRMLACTLALTASMVLTLVMLMRMRLRLDSNEEVLARLRHSVHEEFISVWPFFLKGFFLVVLCKRLLLDLVVEEGCLGGVVGGGASGVCAFDFGALDAADAVVVVVDGCLQDWSC
jgi:hypothetical protein